MYGLNVLLDAEWKGASSVRECTTKAVQKLA